MEPVSKVKALNCHACNRVFNKPEHLRRHSLTHTAVRPHQCTICSRGFARPDALARHLRVHRPHSVSPLLANDPLQVPLSEQDGQARPSQVDQGSVDTGAQAMQAHIADLTPDSYWNTIIWDSEGSTYRPPDSEITSTSSTHVMRPSLHSEPSSDPLSQYAYPLEVPIIDRPIPQWSGMGSQWMVSLGQPAADIPAMPAKILRTALIDTVSLAGSALDPSLFSDRWLNTGLCLFWVKVLPIVPVPHGPTTQLSKLWAPLLISMLTLGSLHIEGPANKAKSVSLWGLVRRVIKGDWKVLVEQQDHFERCRGSPVLITMLFSQIYAILSKDVDLITECVVFQPVPLRLAKAAGLYHQCSKQLTDVDSIPDDLQPRWEEWIARETLSRTLLALHLLDSTIVSMSDALPTAHHQLNPLQLPSDDLVYRAATAVEWAILRLTKSTTYTHTLGSLFCPFLSGAPMPLSITRFMCGALLEGIYSMLVIELEGIRIGANLNEDPKLAYGLERFYAEYLINDLDEVVLLLRWHAVCMSTSMARARIEASRSPRHVFETTTGRRALLHANAVRQIVQTCALTTVQAIILPVSLYDSAIVLLDYIRYSSQNVTNHLHLERSTDWKRVGLLKPTTAWTFDETDHVQFLLDLDRPWTAKVSSLALSTSDITPLIAVLGIMESVWTRCKAYVDDLRGQCRNLS